MGIVRRQSLKRAIVSFVAVLVGTISVLKIYPLDFKIYGLSQFIISCATLITPFASVGVSRLTVRYFPDFNDKASKHHGFLGFLLFLALILFILFSILILIFEVPFFHFLQMFNMKEEVFWENRMVIMFVSLTLIINTILGQFSSNFKRIVVPEIFNNLLIKVALPVLVILYFLKIVGEDGFRYLYAFVYFIAMIGLAGYLMYLKEFSLKLDLSFIKKKMFREMMIYSAFNALSIIGYLLSFRIDNIMITSLIDYESTGHYSFFSYIVNVMVIPYTSMIAISSPIIAQYFKDKNISEIGKLYRQASETLFIFGLFIIGGVWLCFDPLLEITNKADILIPMKATFLFLALGQLFNVTTGLTEPIIGYSKYFRFNFYTVAILAILNIVMNFYLIPLLGIIGAAIATSISLALYNSIQCFFVYIRFRILPFSLAHLKVLTVAAIAFAAVKFLVNINAGSIWQIVVKGSIFTILFYSSLIYFKVSGDFNKLWKDALNRLGL